MNSPPVTAGPTSQTTEQIVDGINRRAPRRETIARLSRTATNEGSSPLCLPCQSILLASDLEKGAPAQSSSEIEKTIACNPLRAECLRGYVEEQFA